MTLPQNVIDDLDFTVEGDWVKDMTAFHTKMGVNEAVRKLDKDQLRSFLKFRIDFLQEELDELKREFDGAGEVGNAAADNSVDALIDLCVVAMGTLNAFDVDSYEAWARVRDANMSKSPGVNASRPNPLGLPDMIKPAGWTAPSHADNVGLFSKVFE